MKTLLLLLIFSFAISKSYGQADSETKQADRGAEQADDPCSPYQKPCANDQECGEKYFNCLEPSAGPPAVEKKFLCKKEKEEDIYLIVAEWKGLSGKNQLLCSFFEDDYLMQFATIIKNECQTSLMSRKEELTKAGFACENTAPPTGKADKKND